jgi:hypothetical protein
VIAPVDLHLRVYAIGSTTQGQLAQGNQVALTKKVAYGLFGLLRRIDFALTQSLQQVIGWQVDELHLIGLFQDGIRNRFADHHAGDLGDDVVQALQVLDVHRRVDIDTGVE